MDLVGGDERAWDGMEDGSFGGVSPETRGQPREKVLKKIDKLRGRIRRLEKILPDAD